MKLTVHVETCCDECNDVVHNHIDCPVCKGSYASTDIYCDMYEEEFPLTITCECGAMFECKSREDLVNDEWELKK